MSDHQIVSALERAGMEVEQVNASKQIDKKVIVAVVKKVAQHPGADRLHLAKIWTGESEYDVVCGANNLREGLKVAFAQIGTVLPGGEKIAKAKLRGEVSEGMLCSELELGLGKDHSGILELPEELELGTPLCDIYPADSEIDLKTPANRSDVLSIQGLAREIAAMTSNELIPLPSPAALEPTPDGPAVVKDGEAARYLLARVAVEAGSPSPSLIAARLRTSGMRSLGALVDITNYVMIETGQPLHAFDADKVRLPITVRFAQMGEELITLDGVKRSLTQQDLVIADESGPIALAGLMGGAQTEVTIATKTILLESAVFDGTVIRKMAKRHGMRTEASARFERGLPVQLPQMGIARAMDLLEEYAGGKLLGLTDQLNAWPWVQRIGLQVSRLSRLLGFVVTSKEAIEALGKLQIEARSYDIVGEATKLVGRPYKYGASYKTDGTNAFDCSYLVDYLYSLIGVPVGFTALGQFMIGTEVAANELIAGDAVFLTGDSPDSATDHYYTRSPSGEYEKHNVRPAKKVGHVGLYIGDGKVVHASPSEGEVVVVSLESFVDSPDYLGARRFVIGLNDYITVSDVPWWRSDIKMQEDLVEEVVRVLGYDKVPSTIPSWRPTTLAFDRSRAKRRRVRDVLYGAGLFEVMTYSFVSQEQLDVVEENPGEHLKLKNPLSSEQAYLRSSLLPSHLGVMGRNRTYAKEVGFYEISSVFLKKSKGDQPDEPLRLGVTLARPEAALAHVKGILDALARELNVEVKVDPAESPVFAPGRYGEVSLGGTVIGRIGQIHPDMVRRIKVEGELAYLEVDLAPIVEVASARQFVPLDRYPTIMRDIGILVPANVTWQQVVEALAPQDVEFVGDYYDAGLPDGFKGLTLRLKVANPERTPTESEAADLEANVLSRLERKLRARSRN